MTFLNPWGLLALLAIPVILGLHFFRQQRQARQIGGLHLWDFARIATPAGRRFERLIASLPLLFQILAAILLALLLAGFDVQQESNARHYSVIVDDSISMQARVDGTSSAQRAAEAIEEWADGNDRFTLVAAGAKPAVLAGPAATKKDLVAALKDWRPESPLANLDDAVNIATKFGGQDSRLLLLTDNPTAAKHLQKSVTLWGVGRPAANQAVVFADRFPLQGGKERIVATVQAFGGPRRQANLSVWHNEQQLATQQVDLQTSQPVAVELEVQAPQQPLRLSLSPADALSADDNVILVPPPDRTVGAYLPTDLPRRDEFEKAVLAIPDSLLATSAAEADLAFTLGEQLPAGPRRVYQFTQPQSTGTVRMASGRDLVAAPANPLTRNLGLAGLIWPFDGSASSGAQAALGAVISYTSVPLLYRSEAIGERSVYKFNLGLANTNLFRHTAFPVLVMNIVEEARSALPGLARTNIRAGEDLLMNLKVPDNQPVSLWLEGEAKPQQQWDGEPPRVLQNLAPGTYTLRGGAEAKSPALAQFRVNLFSQAESDLQPLNQVEPNLKALSAGHLERTSRNMLVFYALLVGLVGCILLGWVYQDAGH